MASIVGIFFFGLLLFTIMLQRSNAFRLVKKTESDSKLSDEQSLLPLCGDQYTVCGYVQLNQFGVSAQPICRCPSQPTQTTLPSHSRSCSLSWDPFDVHTIMHGFDQYKYCGPAPDLPECSGSEVAYVNYVRMRGSSLQVQQHTNYLTCKCEAGRLLQRNDTRFYSYEDSQVLVTTHLCSEAPICNEEELCSTVVRSPSGTFVNHKCLCSSGQICPIHSLRRAINRVDLNKGSYYDFKCEQHQ